MNPRHSRVQEIVEKNNKQNLDTSIKIKKIIHIKYKRKLYPNILPNLFNIHRIRYRAILAMYLGKNSAVNIIL